ncbi:MAG: winged helix-turn-helix domain-containing protein [Acidobacteriota bacterium]|nr:winged helix-turn-helix domain-containing protein [Blastocatellia bacterium]MDW8411523.1 winged helix-turn-helix domain-containing protein [Acidobacteriota bacterium]
MSAQELNTAFGTLIRKIEASIERLNEDGAKAFKARKYDTVDQLRQEAARLIELRNKIADLQKEWIRLSSGKKQPLVSVKVEEAKKKLRQKAKQKKLVSEAASIKERKLLQGLCTPEAAFRMPLLEAIVELGGSAPAKDVLQRVEEKMRGQLNEYDYKPLPFQPRVTRWKKTAQWCRSDLLKEGLIKSGSGRGIWEISEEGRKYLESASGKQVETSATQKVNQQPEVNQET